jgi:hypothetical protein
MVDKEQLQQQRANAGPSTPLRSAQDDTFWVNGGQRTTATAETTAASFGSAALRQDDIF